MKNLKSRLFKNIQNSLLSVNLFTYFWMYHTHRFLLLLTQIAYRHISCTSDRVTLCHPCRPKFENKNTNNWMFRNDIDGMSRLLERPFRKTGESHQDLPLPSCHHYKSSKFLPNCLIEERGIQLTRFSTAKVSRDSRILNIKWDLHAFTDVATKRMVANFNIFDI